MSDLIEKMEIVIEKTCLKDAGFSIEENEGAVSFGLKLRKATAIMAVKTVLEEMHKFSLSYDDKTENSQHFKGTRAIHREKFLEMFAKHNNIPIGGDK